jgi:hypothetical protein
LEGLQNVGVLTNLCQVFTVTPLYIVGIGAYFA